MVKRRYKPVITSQSVAAALDKLLYGHADESIIRSLYRLSLVEDVLNDRDFPSVEHNLAREHALNKILVELIFTGYANKRQQIDYKSPILNASYTDTCEILIEDGQSGFDDIRSWSYFYHRYVRADLGINKEHYSQLLVVSARNLQRLEQVAFKQLLQLLIDAEWASRQLHLQRHLRAQIPVSDTSILIEREAIIEDIMAQFAVRFANYVHIAGAAGTGKTALCHNIATRLIEQNQPDYILWLGDVSNPDIIYDAIWQLHQGRRSGGQQTIRMFLQQHRFLIILDDFSCGQIPVLNELFADLRFAAVITTSTNDISVSGQIYRYHLNNLSPSATYDLVSQLSSVDLTYNRKTFYEITQGNPAAIHAYMYDLITYSDISLDVEAVYMKLSDPEKHLCILLAFYFQGRADSQQLRFFDDVKDETLDNLTQNHVISLSDDGIYQLLPELKRYIAKNSLCQQLATDYEYEIVEKLLNRNIHEINHTALLPLVEHFLMHHRDIFDNEAYLLLLNRFYRIALERGNISLWERILRPYCLPETLQLYVGRCICLRYLGHWDEALLVLDKCLLAAGQQGRFKYQTEILLEIAIIKRNQGRYAEASTLLQQSLTMSKTYNQLSLQSRIIRELAQIALDTEDIVKVRQFLSQPNLFDRQPALYAELLLISEQYSVCIQIVNDALKVVKGIYDRALLLSIRGRCQYQRHYYADALADFMDALADFEMTRDLFAITRTKVQIAGVLISMGDFERSKNILIECLDIQAELKDAAGLTATRHNLNILTHLQAHSGMA